MYTSRCFIKILENIFFKFKEIYVLMIGKKIDDYNILDVGGSYTKLFFYLT